MAVVIGASEMVRSESIAHASWPSLCNRKEKYYKKSEVLTCDHALVVVLDLISTKEVTGLDMAGCGIMGVIDGMNKQITPTPSTKEDGGY